MRVLAVATRNRRDAASARCRAPRSQPYLIPPSEPVCRCATCTRPARIGAGSRPWQAMSDPPATVRTCRRSGRSSRARRVASRCRSGWVVVPAAASGGPSTRFGPRAGSASSLRRRPRAQHAVLRSRRRAARLHRVRRHRSRARRRPRAGVGGAPRGRARDRQVDAAAPGAGPAVGAGQTCVLVSGEESHAQVAARARRLGVSGDAISSRRDATWRTCSRPRATPGRSCSRSTPSRPSATRPARRCRAGRPRSGCAPTLSSGWRRRRASRCSSPDMSRRTATSPVLERWSMPSTWSSRSTGTRARAFGSSRAGRTASGRGRDGVVRDGSARAAEIDPTELLFRAPPRPGRPSRCRRRAGGLSPSRSRRSSAPPTARPASGDRARSPPIPARGGGARPGRGHPARPSRAFRGILGRGPPGRSGVRSCHRGGARLRGHRASPRRRGRRSWAR